MSLRPLVMGVVNVTPDSFSDGGRHAGQEAALVHARRLIAEGADILDIGGESTRPGAEATPETEELTRVIPVIEAIRRESAIPISIDTMKPSVAKAAVAAGASMWNDVAALDWSPHSLEVAAELRCQVVLMHMQGQPATMQDDPRYDDVIAEVCAFLLGRAAAALEAGIGPDRIWLDPGIGFGKTLAHNLALLAHLGEVTALGFPVLLGVSRKGFIRAIDPVAKEPVDRLGGSLACALAGARAGGTPSRLWRSRPRSRRPPAMSEFRGRVLVIAGSDSGGGAGIQADIKAITVLGGYAATAITAVTVQNTLGVSAVHPVPPEIVAAQARAVIDDIGVDAIKTGMLSSVETVEVVAQVLAGAGVPVVIDPVMIAKGGAVLLQARAIAAVRARLIPQAALLTPNAPEAAALTGLAVETTDDLRRAGEALLAMGAAAVLMKGGHVEGEVVTDLLITPSGETSFSGARIETRHTHGTGCTLASAIAAGLAQGLTLEAAVARAWAYVAEAIRRAPGFGAGAGPLDHGWPLREP